MITLYVPVNIDRLPEILAGGWRASWNDSLYARVDDALDAMAEYQAIIGIEFDKEMELLTADDGFIESELESLASRARQPTPEELEAGLFCELSYEAWTWDDPSDLSSCRAMIGYLDGGLTWQESIELFGSAQFMGTGMPADKVTLMSPVDVGQIQSREERRLAVEQTEPVALTSLGAGFWVWLLMMIQYLAFGKTPFEKEKTEASSAKKRGRKSKRKKAKKKAAKAKAGAGEVAPE